MKNWNELSITDKNDIIRVAVQNGITTLPEIRERYNEFAEGGPTISDEEYQGRMRQVAQENWRNWGYRNEEEAYQDQINNPTYDYRSFYVNNPGAVNNAETHWPDTYKGALHRTFSSESAYNGVQDANFNPSGIRGGRWTERGFVPHGESFTVPNVLIENNAFSSGGKIHIKKENRGKFTALKERTGHSASWFKAHGTPAQKKMATFALNARKWKYEDGGILFGEGGDEKSVMLAESRENDVNWIDNWLHSRIPQMANNLDTYYNPTYEDISKKGLGYNADMKKINATNPHSLLPPMTYPMLSIGAKYPQIYKYIPFAENYRQDAAKRVIDSQVDALRNNTNVVDLRDPNVFATLNNNDPYALDFLKRYNKNGTLAANGTTYGASSLDGTNTIVISPFTNNKDVFLHEAVHSATHRYPIQNSAILKIFSDNKNNMYQPDVLYDDKMKNYLKTPTEVYSRLMEFRRHNNLDPSYKVTKEDLNRWRKDAAVDNKKLLDVFSDDVLLQLFNDVAHNNTLQDFREQLANQAAFGGPLVEYAMGGRLRH